MNFNRNEAPDYLSESDHNALMKMRREMWIRGFEGFATGFLLGRFATWAAPRVPAIAKHVTIVAKHKTAVPLLSGALLMTVASITAARNNMHTIHHIMAKAPKQEQVVTEYQQIRHTGLENMPWRQDGLEAAPSKQNEQPWSQSTSKASQVSENDGNNSEFQWGKRL